MKYAWSRSAFRCKIMSEPERVDTWIAAVVAHHDEVERIGGRLLLGRMSRARVGGHEVLALEVFESGCAQPD